MLITAFLIIIGLVVITFAIILIAKLLQSELNPQPKFRLSNSNYRLLVSAQCSKYQDWQCVAVEWSANKNWPGVACTRLLSCNKPKRFHYKYHHVTPTFVASDWAKHPKTGDDYPPYNRPISIVEYLKVSDPQEEYLVIIDPDVIIRKPLNDIEVTPGAPIAQKYDYLNDKKALQKLGKKFLGSDDDLQPLGMPMIIHKSDLKKLAPLWLELTEKIRNDPETKEIAGWIAEMHSYCLAAAQLGLVHTVRNDLADRTPYDREADPYVLHYDLRHTAKNFNWDKRDYLDTDLLAKNAKLMPVPESAPNDRFAQVFETLNAALLSKRN